MTRPLIVYGTLRDHTLLEIVVGDTAHLRLTPTTLHGYAVHWVQDAPFPMCVAQDGACAEALLIDGLTQADQDRLDFYEGGFAYDLVDVGGARLYVPQQGRWPKGAPWSLGDWQARFGALTYAAAREVMAYYGQLTAEEVAARFEMIRVRASATVRAKAAQSLPTGSAFRSDDVTLHASRYPYSNFFALREVDLAFETYGGGRSQVVTRAGFVGTDAAIVLPYDPMRDRVMLVEQFRIGPFLRGSDAPWSIEPIAGRVDAFETPQQAALREAHEEAGLSITRLEPVAEAYPSPGCSTEFFYCYVGLCDLPDGITGIGGEASEAEDIRSLLMPAEELIAHADAMRLTNVPLMTCALWLARHRARLQATY
ncbi:NUDIX domain-containing protein [Nereida sp. MMG025]|uniref:NUDIX domain-containing protein n=1 Tax=Nereida sp. MMG025 TaxID=2909981 RepID=UPI001F24AFBB|nr:NUDIX domain-containing protein [Nereida sp. MMG025]MCF6443420.1 NUDIX domain-containing protein [Nereida sp. MMG025]